jgi:predicted ATPase/class 3 adenylate cyclase
MEDGVAASNRLSKPLRVREIDQVVADIDVTRAQLPNDVRADEPARPRDIRAHSAHHDAVRTELPTGTVTFLFTDVEGSTKLLRELGEEAYARALAEHRRLIREACTAEGGVEVDTQGDAFFFAFPTAPGAVAAASAFTESLASGPIQVRVGLHTGTPLLTDEGYVGDDVHFGARVASSGHGGQVVLSGATAKVVELELTDLGEHRLKDIEAAVPIFQLGDGSFPPLKTISNTNLPRPASSFVGRDTEQAEVLSRIEAGARLVTLSGPGGTGKTRLAIEVASELVPFYKAGVFWVGLATLSDPALVTDTIAQTLGAKDGLTAHIGERELLLLLDNLEQVIDCAPELSELLTACPNLTMLVTSRELLRIQGEVEYAVPPLAQSEAVLLFCERAQLSPGEEIAELCARLDSLPLAVELAAARSKALTPEQILERLSQRLDLLKGGRDADPRHQTLRATIEWSHDLLMIAEQYLFARLSVFAGGCTLEAAEEVCDADLDTLHSLVEKSLLRFTDGRYWMLETIREYAADGLGEESEERELRGGHAAYYLSVAEGANASESAALRRLDPEQDNMRAALAWFSEEHQSEFQLRLVSALTRFWVVRGYLREGLLHAEAALISQTKQSPQWRVKVLAAASDFARMQGDTERGRSFCAESLVLAREIGDYAGVAQALHELGEAASADGDYKKATEYFQEAITAGRAAGSNGAGSVGNLGLVAFLQEDYERAMPLFEESVELFRERGHESGVLVGLCNLVEATVMLGRPEEARPRIRECLELAGDLHFVQVIAQSLDATAAVLAGSGDARSALRLVGAADAMYEDLNLSPPDADRQLGDRAVDSTTSLLGADVAGALREEGRSMDVKEAIELALASIG